MGKGYLVSIENQGTEDLMAITVPENCTLLSIGLSRDTLFVEVGGGAVQITLESGTIKNIELE